MLKRSGKKSSSAEYSQGRVGIVTKSFDSAFYNRMVVAASNYLLARGIHAIVESNLERDELETFNTAAQRAYDALIIHADRLPDDELNQFMQKHQNVIMLNRHLPLFPDRCINVDNTLGGQLAAKALIEQGHTRIAMVTGPADYFETNYRSTGFKREMSAHGLHLQAELEGNFEKIDGESAMDKIFKRHADVTAVFFQNDEMAFGGLSACRRLGLHVPADISIIGFDGVPMCDYVSPRLTSIQQPLEQLGEHAAKTVCSYILKIEPTQHADDSSYAPVLEQRESVAPPAIHSTQKILLTHRERECLMWTANGKTSWEIAVILGVSESTATFHLRNATTKLKASNRAHAAAKAIWLGLIDFHQDTVN